MIFIFCPTCIFHEISKHSFNLLRKNHTNFTKNIWCSKTNLVEQIWLPPVKPTTKINDSLYFLYPRLWEKICVTLLLFALESMKLSKSTRTLCQWHDFNTKKTDEFHSFYSRFLLRFRTAMRKWCKSVTMLSFFSSEAYLLWCS